jgi:hypothetical protein
MDDSIIRGTVSKYVTNGSKTAVMDAIGFLWLLLDSSTVELHDSLGSKTACAYSEVGFSSQNGDRPWGVYYRRAAFYYVFYCGRRDSVKRIFIKKYFLFTVGSVCRVKKYTSGWYTFRWWGKGWNGRSEVAQTTAKNFHAAGFDALVKRWDKNIIVGEDMSRNKCSLEVRISHDLRFISICDLFTDSPLYINCNLSGFLECRTKESKPGIPKCKIKIPLLLLQLKDQANGLFPGSMNSNIFMVY